MRKYVSPFFIYLFLPLLFFIGANLNAQNSKTDSLLSLLKNDKEDTSKVNHLNALGKQLRGTNMDTAITLSAEALVLAEKIKWKKGTANSYGQLATYNYLKADYTQALDYFLKALKIDEELDNKNGMARWLGNMGNVHLVQANYPKALDHYLQALKFAEEMDNKTSIAGILGNIGVIYMEQSDYSKALDYYFRYLKIAEELENKNFQAIALGNIGIVYDRQMKLLAGDPEGVDSLFGMSLQYYLKALEMDEALQNKNGVARHLGHIGVLYFTKAKRNSSASGESNSLYEKALDHYLKALKIDYETKNKKNIAFQLGNIGAVYLVQKKYNEAFNYLYRALALSDSIGALDHVQGWYHELSSLYESSDIPLRDSVGGKVLTVEQMRMRSLYYYKRYVATRDTLFSEENKQDLVRKELNYEFDKKEAVTKAEAKALADLADAKASRQRTILMLVSGFLLLVLVLAGLIFRSLRETRSQKKIIEAQKALVEDKNILIEEQKLKVEEKNKEMTDSINYASRIQQALLASDSYLTKHLQKEYFVIFKPKDIVSGDFYWATRRGNKLYLAVCDSTGHGVPGAFMSLLNIAFLNEAINEKQIDTPGDIFTYVRKRLIQNISKDGRQDGMDGILVCFDADSKSVTYAAANNSPLLILDNHIEHLSVDKMPVGKGEISDAFKTYSFPYIAGSALFLYTDGYADQFGGPKGKKFKYKQLTEKLLAIHHNPLAVQKEDLEKTIEQWKGNLEQVDDILVIGIQL